VIGKASSVGQAFHWKLRQASSQIMSQISSIPKTLDSHPQVPTLFGIASCLSKIQLQGWTNSIIIHVDTSTARLLQSKSEHPFHNCLKFISHLCLHSHCTFVGDNSISLARENTYNAILKQSLPPVVFPTTVIEVYIHKQIVWKQLLGNIRLERHKQPVFNYLRSKDSWSLTTTNSSYWTLHDQVLQINKHRHIFNLKFNHKWLPVASHGSITPDQHTCLRCSTAVECQYHWYRCDHDHKQDPILKHPVFIHLSKRSY
jgi:hypothetical protein